MQNTSNTLLSDWILPSRTTFLDLIGPYYPFSNVGAHSLFEECTIQHLSDPNDSMKILLLGCGDLRNALATVADRARKSDKLQVHLNDICPSIMARNLLFLAIIDESGFDIEKQENLDFLWNVWFNAKWEKPAAKRFITIVQRLLEGYLPPNVFVPQGRDALNEVFKKWLALMDSDGCMLSELIKKISSERKKSIGIRWSQECDVSDGRLEPRDYRNMELPFRDANSNIAAEIGILLGDGPFSPRVPGTSYSWNRVKEEIIYYFEHGYCYIGRRNSPVKYVTFNPTFLDPVDAAWRVSYSLTPFEGFFSLIDNKKLEEDISRGGDQHKISLLSVCQKIFKEQVSSYKKSRPAELHFHVRNPLEFCLDTLVKFDLIDCSLLSDKLGLANVLLAVRSRLSDHPDALAITTSKDWMALNSTVLEYVQTSLRVPLSMIPAIYGFKLANDVELGEPIPTYLHVAKMMYATLIWRRCPDWENLVLTPSPTITKCFTELYDRSFKSENFKPPPMDDVSSFTPLTYHLIANNFVSRFGLNPVKVDLNDKISLSIPHHFQLQYRTLNAWAAGNPSLKRFTSVEFEATEIGKLILESCQQPVTPKARLVLVPSSFPRTTLDFEKSSDVHFIDNFTFYRKEGEHGHQMCFSFFLTADNGIEGSHNVIVYDIQFKKILFYAGLLGNMRQNPFKQPYPLALKMGIQGSIGPIRVVKFLESEDDYEYAIMLDDPVVPETDQFSTDREFPCEAAHSCTSSFVSAHDCLSWRSITFKLAHPLSVKGISNTLTKSEAEMRAPTLLRKHGMGVTKVSLVLKAIMEPWIHDFRRKPCDRIDPESLKAWKEEDLSELVQHLRWQFNLSHDDPTTVPLNSLRELIQQMFSIVALDKEAIDQNALLIVPDDGEDGGEIYWYLRFHGPIRRNRNGVPFLSMTVKDRGLAGELFLKQKTISEQALNNEHKKAFPPSNSEHVFKFESQEQANLFRYLIRLNSTKVLPNSWQKENLAPPNQVTSCMATFITPLYESRIHAFRKLFKLKGTGVERKPTSPLPSQSSAAENKRHTCANCAKCSFDNLKVCGTCKMTYYCGPICQRTAWPRHKLTCKPPAKS